MTYNPGDRVQGIFSAKKATIIRPVRKVGIPADIDEYEIIWDKFPGKVTTIYGDYLELAKNDAPIGNPMEEL